MGKKDPRIDAYIARSADFARPILTHIRRLIHAGCPEVEETIKWSHCAFEHHGLLCGMAAFKHYCAFGFWKAKLLADGKPGAAKSGAAAGEFDRLTSVSDLPGDATLIRLVKKAAALNQQGVKLPVRPRPRRKQALVAPPELMRALRKNRQALSTFEDFSPSHRREYVAWITEAKTDETRGRRLETAVEWMAEGKIRNWKYVRRK